MPEFCSMPGCTSHRGKGEVRSLSFYHLPRDEHARQLWLISMKKEITVSAHTRICSLHFVGGNKNKEYPVPTLFPW